MPPDLSPGGGAEVVERYALREPDLVLSLARAEGRLGAAEVRDSARRLWRVEARRDRARGRTLVLSPVGADLEPFRCSADGHRPETHLAVSGAEWTLLALLVAGHDGGEGRPDEALRAEAFRFVSRIVVEAQHRLLLGAAEDEDGEG